VFQLSWDQDYGVTETADITFYTLNESVCLLACFDFALCKVAVYESTEDRCQLFTTRVRGNLTLTFNSRSDVYYRTCEGTCFNEHDYYTRVAL